MGSEDPSHFGRRSVTSDRADPFESMREQMEKERENFFKGVNPRDWPSENNARGGLFNRAPRTSFGGFPSGPGIRAPRYVNDFPEELDGFGLMPGSGHSLPRHRKSSSGSGQNVEDDVSDHSSNCSGNSNHSGETETGIPINVVHEKTLPRNKYGQAARNTTELPAKASGNESPRLERAHSEPPNKFKQRLNLANPLYSTIPENSESSGQTNRPMSHLDSRNPLKASASAPSVPSSSHQAQESHPVPPPRRSPPRNNMSNPIPPAQSILMVNLEERSPVNLSGVDMSKVSTIDLVNMAKHSLDRGDLARAVQVIALVKGEAGRVVSDWLGEARLTLETMQAVQVVTLHSLATSCMHMPQI